jgi:hypothetical protein
VLAALHVPALESATVERTSGAAGVQSCGSLTIAAQPLQLLTPSPELQAEVECGGRLLVARSTLAPGGPELLVVADPDLWNNQGLGRADHAALAHQIFVDRLDAKGVVFDETIHGFTRSRGLLAEAFRFPLLPGTLEGLLLLGTVLWAGMGRFGSPLPAAAGLPAGKEVLIANTAELLAQGGQAADSLARYYQQTLRAVAARFFLPPDLPERELALRLSELGKRRGSPLDLLAFAGRIASLGGTARDRKTEPRVAALARRLYRWRLEMTDGH